MPRKKLLTLLLCGLAAIGVVYGAVLVRRGFSARDEPSWPERAIARAVRDLAIPRHAASEANPWMPTPDNLEEAREIFLARCAECHGNDGRGLTSVGRNLYPKPPNLLLPRTQNLTDGQIHYIIENGVRLTGMPAWGSPHEEQNDVSWKLVLFIRQLREPTAAEIVQ